MAATSNISAQTNAAQTNLDFTPPAAATNSTEKPIPSGPDLTNATAVVNPSVYKKMSLDELMSLDVTSVSKQPEPYGQAPAAIQVVTGDDIRRSGASSIPEALRLADNLEVAQKTSHDWAISARGFNTALANKLLVLMDGRTVYSPLFSGVFWNAQDYLLEDIDRIEVISGPGGTLWGANAVNGVINITSKSAADTQGLYVEGGGGTSLEEFGGLRYGGTLASNVYYRVYAKAFHRGDEIFDDGKDASDAWSMGQGGFRIDANGSDDNVFTLQGDGYGSGVDVPSGGDGKSSGGNVLGRWTHTISDDSDMHVQLYYDRTHLTNPTFSTPGIPGDLTDDLDTYDLDFQYRFRLWDRNQIVWGLGYRFTHDVVGAAPNLAFLPSILNQSLYSGFVQDEFRIFDNLFFTAGAKVEHNDYTGFEFEPSVRLQWNVTTNQMIWAAVSRAVRTPSRVDHDEAVYIPAFSAVHLPFLQGGPNFESETVLAYEAGYRAQLWRKTSGSVSVFYNDYNDVRSLTTTPTTVFPLYFANGLEGETYGMELSGDYQVLDGWRLHGGYDLLKEHIHTKPGQVDVINNALNETGDPQQQFFARSSFDLPKNVELEGGLRWIDKLILNNNGSPATVPSYYELDARLGWHPIPSLEISIVGQGLLHAQHQEYGLANAGGEEIKRAVYAKVAWRF